MDPQDDNLPALVSVPDDEGVKTVNSTDVDITSTEVEIASTVEECPCGGGQSCIVARRRVGAIVHEDIVLQEAGLSVRENCTSEPTDAQNQAMHEWFRKHNRPNSVILL